MAIYTMAFKSSSNFSIFLYILLSCTCLVVQGSNIADMEEIETNGLMKAETELLALADSYIVEAHENLKILEDLFNNTNIALDLAREDIEGYIGNPISSYLLIKRFTSWWAEIPTYFESEDSRNNGKQLKILFR